MTARQVDEAAARLRELRAVTVANLALAAVAFGVAITASLVLPSLALPLLAGGIGATGLGMRAFLRRCFLLDDLAAEEDAQAIAAVRRYAARISVFPDVGRHRGRAQSPTCEEPDTDAQHHPRGS